MDQVYCRALYLGIETTSLDRLHAQAVKKLHMFLLYFDFNRH